MDSHMSAELPGMSSQLLAVGLADHADVMADALMEDGLWEDVHPKTNT